VNPVWHFLNGIAHVSAWVVGGARVGGVLSVNTTEASTGADTNETDLWTYSLPANTLNVNGKGVRVTAWGVNAANVNNKTWKVYFGSTAVYALGPSALNGSSFRVVMEVARTGAAAQIAAAFGGAGGTLTTATAAPAGDTTGAITIKVTGQNGTASASDIVFKGAIVEVLN
jgi:hypothetical protein